MSQEVGGATTGRGSILKARLLLVSLGLLLGVAVTEVVLRVAGRSYPSFYTVDDLVGHRHRPGATGWYVREGRAHVSITPDGRRDVARPFPKAENVVRIALLGDSYAEALQVDARDTFWKVMERRLNAQEAFGRGRKVEVLNFGVSGYGTAQELLALRHYAWNFAPDLIVLTITTGNDIRNNSAELEPEIHRPFFRLGLSGLVLDNSFSERRTFVQSWILPVVYRLGDYSFVAQNLLEFGRSIRRRGSKASGTGLDAHVYRPPNTSDWREAWEITEALLVQTNKEVIDRRARLFVVVLSSPIQVHPDESVRRAKKQELDVEDLFYPDRRIRTICYTHGIPSMALAPRMRDYADQNKVFLHGFGDRLGTGHWNESGHRLAGEWIADWLESELSRNE